MTNIEATFHFPRVGIGVLVWKDGKVLIGKRKGSHGSGEYAWPGGHLEYMESIVDCAKREVREEVGADWLGGEPEVREPEKCEGWQWRNPDDLPQPLFATLPSYFEALHTGKNFFDA